MVHIRQKMYRQTHPPKRNEDDSFRQKCVKFEKKYP